MVSPTHTLLSLAPEVLLKLQALHLPSRSPSALPNPGRPELFPNASWEHGVCTEDFTEG